MGKQCDRYFCVKQIIGKQYDRYFCVSQIMGKQCDRFFLCYTNSRQCDGHSCVTQIMGKQYNRYFCVTQTTEGQVFYVTQITQLTAWQIILCGIDKRQTMWQVFLCDTNSTQTNPYPAWSAVYFWVCPGLQDSWSASHHPYCPCGRCSLGWFLDTASKYFTSQISLLLSLHLVLLWGNQTSWLSDKRQ